LRDELERLRKKLAETQNELRNAKAQIAQLESQVKDLLDKVAELEAELKEAKEQIASLKNELKDAKAQVRFVKYAQDDIVGLYCYTSNIYSINVHMCARPKKNGKKLPLLTFANQKTAGL
jgi:septal ring factor EnvC (AmiA/AmiB activator)